jgi:hypothetical protein
MKRECPPPLVSLEVRRLLNEETVIEWNKTRENAVEVLASENTWRGENNRPRT